MQQFTIKIIKSDEAESIGMTTSISGETVRRAVWSAIENGHAGVEDGVEVRNSSDAVIYTGRADEI